MSHHVDKINVKKSVRSKDRLLRPWTSRYPEYYYEDLRRFQPRHYYEQPVMPYTHRDRRHRHRHHGSDQSMRSTVTKEMLELHNRHRARHCARPLTISQRLNRIAQDYAEHLAATSKFEHSGTKFEGQHMGENLYMNWISDGHVTVSTKAAVKFWYDEIALHDFDRPIFSKETGHFTQMVWKDSRKMGVGVALSPDKREVYFVTTYFPGGNIIGPGTFEKNVLPPNC
ncbi:unnamed protein product [Adineta steineri]|uniref:SCP domain-containing protein n=1 Tax=Adineta steineri TaxID=433720 RepID=A0A813PRC3_9BILA|nr:unnamed protein product [Adineta steineri]